jgi:hypothetical protein
MVSVLQIAKVNSLTNSNSFIILVQIQNDGLGLRIKAFYDIEADISLLISPETVTKAMKHLNATFKRLFQPIQLADYRRQLTGKVIHKLIAIFELDGRRFRNQNFLVTNIRHDVFIS